MRHHTHLTSKLCLTHMRSRQTACLQSDPVTRFRQWTAWSVAAEVAAQRVPASVASATGEVTSSVFTDGRAPSARPRPAYARATRLTNW